MDSHLSCVIEAVSYSTKVIKSKQITTIMDKKYNHSMLYPIVQK